MKSISKSKTAVKIVFFITCFLLFIVSIVLLVLYQQSSLIWVAPLVLLFQCIGIYALWILFKDANRRYISSSQSFGNFIDKIILKNNLGIIIYDLNETIQWTSSFIEKRFGNKLVGKTMKMFFDELKTADDSQNIDKMSFDKNNIYQEYTFSYKNKHYIVNNWDIENAISIRDVTEEKNIVRSYEKALSVVGEVEIDNYQLYQSLLSVEQFSGLNREVIRALDTLVERFDLVYRQYSNNKFLIITNKSVLDLMREENFEFFRELHNSIKFSDPNMMLSVSAGFAYGTDSLNEKMENAKKALLQAQSRGGDQIAIFSNIESAKYFGSTREILPSVDRTKIKTLTKLIESRLASEDITKVIIFGHANADLDALGSALGIYMLARNYNKDAYICTSTQDVTTKNVMREYFGESNDIFIKSHHLKSDNKKLEIDDQTLIFLVDNSHPNRTDFPELLTNAKNSNVLILDHHRLSQPIDFAPRENRYVDPSASSASEIVTEILMFVTKTIEYYPKIIQMLLNGIYLDTLQFQKHTTFKTFEAASWLQSKGANAIRSASILKIDAETYAKVADILQTVEEVKPGFFLAYKDVSLPDDVISIAAEEILRISGRKASFVVARKEKKQSYKLSARGIDTNVQIIAETVGGGGHFGMAAAVSNESLPIFIDNLKQAIVSVKNESNFN
ncbi:GGDEF domain-containing protein [Mycoplasmopsis columbinasalis]|uniref:Putative bifunctional signaling protein/50S ribosomal protein L9 n=1 Tax=Mycoplasmopsis columbinasalis TaxID=114880 RepID=A0A449BA56_9BACT|nr:DHH family phosphoesterase [Mycoplasmopsis columbinasalis]VEU78081.1 putative bifunctional signaling protein/50S ribosomal protein L9 [Mycoplasmopsis columbinasalis]